MRWIEGGSKERGGHSCSEGRRIEVAVAEAEEAAAVKVAQDKTANAVDEAVVAKAHEASAVITAKSEVESSEIRGGEQQGQR